MWLYFIIFSVKVYLALKRDYHILFVYWLIVYDVFLKISRNILNKHLKKNTNNTNIYKTNQNKIKIYKNKRLPGACNRSPGSKLFSITTQLHCGSHLGGRARLPDTILGNPTVAFPTLILRWFNVVKPTPTYSRPLRPFTDVGSTSPCNNDGRVLGSSPTSG
jgi:hypothetical protein